MDLSTVLVGRPSSAHIALILPSQLHDLFVYADGGYHAHCKDDEKRFFYRLVASSEYNNFKGLRKDCVMLRNTRSDCGEKGKNCLFFGNIQTFLSFDIHDKPYGRTAHLLQHSHDSSEDWRFESV